MWCFKSVGAILSSLFFLVHIGSIIASYNLNVNSKNFTSVPTTVRTFENDTVLLPCYYNSPIRFVRWYRDEALLLDSESSEVLPPERIELWSNGSLQVSNVRTVDTGDYMCTVGTPWGQDSQVHAIEVQYPPELISTPSGLIETAIGSVFEIVCDVRGVPEPIITWRGTGIDPNDAKLKNKRHLLVEVQSREMSGPIECVAANGVGQPVVAGVYLNVLFEPEVRADAEVVHTKIDMRARLECLVEAAPAASVHWFHHGMPIQLGIRLIRHDVELLTNKSQTHYVTESKHALIIRNVKDHDLGMYECRAENSIGFRKVLIELTGRPVVSIFKPSPVIASTTAHKLIWETESLSPITEYKLRFRQIPSGNVTPQNRPLATSWTNLTIPAEVSDGPIHTISYTLHGLQPASVYESLVTSRNRYGWSDNSKILRFATGGEIELPNISTEPVIPYEDIEDNFLTEVNAPNFFDYSTSDQKETSSRSSTLKISLSTLIILILFAYVLNKIF